MDRHSAAVATLTGSSLEITLRSTPEPGPNEVLINVKSVALNQVDILQRDAGIPAVPIYPAVFGSDVAGIVVKRGNQVDPATPQVGSRVIAIACSCLQSGSPDYGAFQRYVLVKAECVTALPESLSFNQGCILPVATLTALSAWSTLGIPINTSYTSHDRQAVLIWGGASSVGTLCIQSAKLMGYTVYTTASSKNHEYLESLGADATFDYENEDVIADIIETAQRDDVWLNTGIAVVRGSLAPTLAVLDRTRGASNVKVAHTPTLDKIASPPTWADIREISMPITETERRQQIRNCFRVWLTAGLESGAVVPSPKIQIEAGGLHGINRALDLLKAKVSCTKIVVPI